MRVVLAAIARVLGVRESVEELKAPALIVLRLTEHRSNAEHGASLHWRH